MDKARQGEEKAMARARFFQEEQENMIMTLLKRNGHVSVEEITEAIGISASTARLRLGALQERGLLTRTHGGAVERALSAEDAARGLHFTNLREKQAIAAAARETVREGDILAIGEGSTAALFAKALHGLRGITVVTSSLYVANELLGDESIEVRICGGVLKARTGGCSGQAAEAFFTGIRVSKSYIGADSVHADFGVTSHETDARTESTLAACAAQCFVLADHTKFYLGPFLEKVAPIERVHTLFTDAGADDEALVPLRERGVTVVVAPG